MDLSNPTSLSGPAARSMTEVLGCLRRGGVILTGNARAARALTRSFGEVERAAGKDAWPTPPIYDWETWLSILWNQHLFHAPQAPLPLSPWQERAVWKKQIGTASGEAEPIAKLAAEAWQLLSQYNSHGERRLSWQSRATPDAEAYQRWSFGFDRECHRNNWITRSELPALLTNSIMRSSLPLPSEMLLLGFDRITPTQQGLLDAVAARGCAVRQLQPAKPEQIPRIVKATDLREELGTCAAWLRNKLESNPQSRIAVLVPDISAVRGELERTFRRVLMPESTGIDDRHAMPWEFSLGQPLATVPVVRAALLLLRWLIEPLAQAEISWLMLSGFAASSPATEGSPPPNSIEEMAVLDAEMRKQNAFPPQATLAMFAAYRPLQSSVLARTFLSGLSKLQDFATAELLSIRNRNVANWLEVAGRALRKVCWPGSRPLNSIEFQALNRWETFKNDAAALSFDGSVISYQAFVTLLDTYSQETIFSLESSDAPIQIMGPFESSGQSFEALWFLSVDDAQWPPNAQLHPLLPPWLQREAAMPHASVTDDWQLAQQVTQRISSSAAEVVFSYAQRDVAGELRPSPLLRAMHARVICSSDFLLELDLPPLSPPTLATLPYADTLSVPWPIDLHAGGADILQRQSACPFQSFATRRLGAKELNDAERGLTPLERGKLLHEVLESLWSDKASSEQCLRNRSDLLNAIASRRLRTLLEYHIKEAFEKQEKHCEPGQWSRSYLQIERQRLENLLSQWLEYESERVDFAVVEREGERHANINGLMLRLRVDRVDQVAGGRLILDYKTGDLNPAMWDGERPDNPQLPIYAVHGGIEDLKGLLVAQIRTGEMKFKGRVENATATVTDKLSPGDELLKKPLNDTMLGGWSDTLSILADDFILGNASVSPKAYPKTCKHCALPSLCRVAETTIPLEAAASGVEFEDEAEELTSE